MAERTGGELVQDFLGAYEVPYVFGNPGTTETTFLAAVAASKATYIWRCMSRARSASRRVTR
jgi:benzoylformate decarboxylase